MRERTGKHLRPLAKECAAGVVPALLSALLKPLYKAHKEAIRVFWERIHDIIGLGLQEAHLRQLYRDVRWQASTLLPAFRKVRAWERAPHTCARCVRLASGGGGGGCVCGLPCRRGPRCHLLNPPPLLPLPLPPRLPPPQIRTITRGEVAEADTSDAALKLLSDLTVPLPELVALMGAVSFYEVRA